MVVCNYQLAAHHDPLANPLLGCFNIRQRGYYWENYDQFVWLDQNTLRFNWYIRNNCREIGLQGGLEYSSCASYDNAADRSVILTAFAIWPAIYRDNHLSIGRVRGSDEHF